MVKIVGLSGIGSSDAMIINLFQESKIPLMITADVVVKNNIYGVQFHPEKSHDFGMALFNNFVKNC